MIDTDTMPPAVNSADAETDEQRKWRLGATMPPAGSRGFYGAAMDAANRDNAGPPRETNKSDSQEFLQRVMSSLKPQAGSALPANAAGAGNSGDPSRSTMPPASVKGGRILTSSEAANIPLRREPPPEASSSAGSTQTMPPVNLASSERSQPNQTQTAMPPAGTPPIVAPQEASSRTMPPATFDTVGLKPHDISQQQQGMPPAQLGPEMQRYQDLAKQGDPKLPWWKKVLDVIGSLHPIGQAIETAIPGSPQNYNFKLNRAGMRAAKEQSLGEGQQKLDTGASQAQFNTPEKRRAYMEKNADLFDDVSDFQKHDWVLAGKFPQKEPAPEKSTDKKIDEYTNDRGQRVLTFQRADNSTYDKAGGKVQEKETGHTSPFEAFAYGAPDEKKSAQDFLDLEHRLGGKYRTPSEFEEKYRLFKQDPETYRAMFGDKTASGPDRATATKMLTYFDRRRREINQDFTLEDAQKQEQLKDVENLEQPFLDAVQPGANRAGGAGGAGDRVEVVHPNGQRGTIPRSQVPAAKRKGYRVAE